eukprot:5293468-Pyramimonas_sp.AAC.2
MCSVGQSYPSSEERAACMDEYLRCFHRCCKLVQLGRKLLDMRFRKGLNNPVASAELRSIPEELARQRYLLHTEDCAICTASSAVYYPTASSVDNTTVVLNIVDIIVDIKTPLPNPKSRVCSLVTRPARTWHRGSHRDEFCRRRDSKP